jgi:hypothetical protein
MPGESTLQKKSSEGAALASDWFQLRNPGLDEFLGKYQNIWNAPYFRIDFFYCV